MAAAPAPEAPELVAQAPAPEVETVLAALPELPAKQDTVEKLNLYKKLWNLWCSSVHISKNLEILNTIASVPKEQTQ